MFFSISPVKQDNFPIHYQHQNLSIGLDTGWNVTYDHYGNKIFYKGYIDNGPIENYIDSIASQEEPLYTGNFCVLKCFDKGISLKTDRLRSFPIWYDTDKGLTNLVPYDYTCWTDSYVTLLDNGTIVESKFNLVNLIDSNILPFDQVVNQVDKILRNKITTFADNLDKPIKVFLTGGIDTTTLFSYIRNLKIPYELVNCLHTDLDYFYLKNHDSLRNFWGYTQFHYWREPSVLLSGAPGDEFTARSPTTANMLLRYYDTDIPSVMTDMKTSLHHEYFSKYLDLFYTQKTLTYKSLDQVIKECLNLILNDWQHWHLGNTLSYTPLRDIEIFNMIARLALPDLKEQIMNSTVQVKLIENNCPELLDILSKQKNSKNYWENLTKILT